MPIPKKILSRHLSGARLKLARTIRTDRCSVEIPAGSEMLVADVANAFALKSAEPCPCCGVTVRLDRAVRDDVFLADDPAAPPLESLAFWNNRAQHNDHTWSECSNCGFTVENYKAIKHGISSDDYAGVKYKFCPKCGKRMAVRNSRGEVVCG